VHTPAIGDECEGFIFWFLAIGLPEIEGSSPIIVIRKGQFVMLARTDKGELPRLSK
jgi:hypothetical protein